jgi:hypothetical protein
MDATDNVREVDSALDRVIEQTVSVDLEQQMDLRVLCAVARKFVGQSWCPESVTPEMVAAVLTWRLGHLRADGQLWREMVEIIGASLLDDDYSRARMESLWKKLGESVT